MAMTWTEEQQKVIDLRGRNILVSAAAGSGKTAVLVERILTMITDRENPVDIDSLLIVTFTRAAAAEMRERIRGAIESRLEQEPENEHLQRQSTLIHSAQINTIDGFCSYVIRNYFHMIDLDPGYRTADEGELKLLKADVMREVLEAAYAAKNPDYEDFVECYAAGKNDSSIGDYVLQLYEYSMSYPWPAEWLESCRAFYQVSSLDEMMETDWMRAMLREAEKNLEDARELTEMNLAVCDREEGPYMYRDALESDLGFIRMLQRANGYDEWAKLLSGVKYARLSSKKDSNVSDRLKEQVKDGRTQVKDILNELRDSYFSMSAQQVLESLQRCSIPIAALIDVTLAFAKAFAAKKREKNLVDFADMEHFALEILWKKDGENPGPTQAGKELAERFTEIFIDEYQDSNLVQETILRAVSKLPEGGHNIFMVGDVKQSIYRFRLARPELFMEKFHSYSTEDSIEQRIDLHKNFRSRDEVLKGVNYIFHQIMGEELGKVEYDKDAALYPGASFPVGDEPSFRNTELLLVEKDGAGLEEESGSGRNAQEIEALAVAARIHEIVGKELVLDKASGTYRKTGYGDIVILLRTMSGWADTFGQVLASQGIPSYSASKTGYFSAVEVVTVLNYLHILDNPRQDIPYGAVLHSPVVGCDAEELAKIRNHSQAVSFCDCTEAYALDGEDEVLRSKINRFLEQYQYLRQRVPHTPIHELILMILKETKYDIFAAAMPAGEQREANLRMLVEKAMEFEKTSYRGLFNFIRYIEHLQRYDVDFGEVNISGGKEDIVQIMSIHKSKGLEFPIVFVSGMGKQFNQQDVNASLVIHQDLGIGADCIFPDRRIRFTTLMKQVIRHQTKVENLGEELRVLYVAMTRAKEKLILTGAVDKLEKRVVSCQRLVDREEVRLPYGTLEKARNYLDWVLPALARHESFRQLYDTYVLECNPIHPLYLEKIPMEIRVITPLELILTQVENQTEQHISRKILEDWDSSVVYDSQLREQLKERFSYEYPYIDQRDIPVKVSVSELKKQSHTVEDSYELFFEPDVVPLVPQFMQEEEPEYRGAARGTAYHRVLECLDLSDAASVEAVQMQVQQMVDNGRMDEKMQECIDAAEIFCFAQSSLGRRMAAAAAAGNLFREQPFVISQPASTMKERWGSETSILVQGIIDIYFYENGEIVVADYKTDAVRNPRELAERYHIQLDYYAKALERLTGISVKEKIIYSFTLGQEIRL